MIRMVTSFTDKDSGLQEVTLACVHRPGILPGDLVEVYDALMDRSWVGKVISAITWPNNCFNFCGEVLTMNSTEN